MSEREVMDAREAAEKRPREAPTPSYRASVRRAAEEILGAVEGLRTWMDAGQAAAYIGMSPDEFRKLVRETPEIPEYRISERRVRYHRPDLDEWMLSRAS